ncbi:PAS domain-containing sensor histidine kinase [Lacinutrix sp. MedPE-SW]|uniref:sensor histidine kinase n=1 Tax=Lacinutrix sp. MedPE-SW TaxID=1860087 RepID=UPI000914D51C|nr:PAS domain-containing sensor histidine kinase [Lacinutrix sp. MedPE-SW]OIQ22373.1 MAG: histidine kinase [Lacinutrix sp. MedPE-SW]
MEITSPESSLEQLQAALEISKIGVWSYNEKLNRVYFSKSSKAIIGYEDDASFGNNIDDWNDLVHEEDKEQYFKDFNDRIKGVTNIYINRHRVKCKNGKYKWILDQGQIINNPIKDGYIHFVGTHIDITQQVNNKTKVDNALTIATKQNNKLKNFAHIVTHNLKQYSGNFESLLEFYDDAEDDSEKEEIIGHLKNISKSLDRTIQNLNQIVSVQSNVDKTSELLNIHTFIEETLKLLDIVIVKSEALIINKVDSEIHINYHSAYLESIILNLLTNAIKYKHPDRKPIIIISSKVEDNKLTLCFKDNGRGIDLKRFGKDIFGLYKTFHNNANAEGVGLYLVKNQVESFGGKIEVESDVGVGTTFKILMTLKKAN